jgi:hypothetical protein
MDFAHGRQKPDKEKRLFSLEMFRLFFYLASAQGMF